jgi:CubicO group peptidase (beta-lactamase class C family)
MIYNEFRRRYWRAAASCLLAAALGIGTCGVAHAKPIGPAAFEGVWAAERHFGRAIAGGDVTVKSSNDVWTAAISTYVATATHDANGTLRFVFPEGSQLLVRSSGDPMLGQWVQPAPVRSGDRYASPVALQRLSAGVSHGTVAPLDDVEHFYLVVQADPTGALSAFFRNPEGNLGGFLGSRTVAITGNEVHLRREGRPDVVGVYDGEHRALTIPLTNFGGTFTFHKERDPNASDVSPRAGSSGWTYHVPVQDGDGWQTASLRDAGLKAGPIADLMNSIVRSRTTSLASPYSQSVQSARHGKLVLDEYFYGFSEDQLHDVRSAAKSVTTLLVGRAIQDGAPFVPDTLIYPLFGQYAPFAHDDARKQRISVADLMTMSSGYACDDNDDATPGNEDAMQSQTAQPDWYKYTLDLPMAFDPGTRAVYCSAGINLLGGIVAKFTNGGLANYFYDRFAGPMQFQRYAMPLTPPPLNTAYMAGGGYFRPRDFLKFGQLFLDRGEWNGRSIIDPSWLEASASPRSGLNDPGDYGYGWHLSTLDAGGKKYKAISAGGNGGQLLFVLPQLDMTVMITAGNYGQYPVWRKFQTEPFERYILPAAQ